MLVSGASNLFAPGTDFIQDANSIGALTDFETVTGAGTLAGKTIDFDLTSIVENGSTPIGDCSSNAAFNSCTPANSPFTLVMDITGTQLTVEFTMYLDAYTGSSSGGSTVYKGVFAWIDSGTFVGLNGCNGLATNITNFINCEAGGGTIQTNWSATESPTGAVVPGVPEPMSVGLLGSVLLLTGRALYRRRKQQNSISA
jgi:hypothetical protein